MPWDPKEPWTGKRDPIDDALREAQANLAVHLCIVRLYPHPVLVDLDLSALRQFSHEITNTLNGLEISRDARKARGAGPDYS